MLCVGSTVPYVVVPEMNEAQHPEPSDQYLRSIAQSTDGFQPRRASSHAENGIVKNESCPAEKMFSLNLNEPTSHVYSKENQTLRSGLTKQADGISLNTEPTSYIREKESYLTINEALHGQEVALCSTSEPQTSLNGDLNFQDFRDSSLVSSLLFLIFSVILLHRHMEQTIETLWP